MLRYMARRDMVEQWPTISLSGCTGTTASTTTTHVGATTRRCTPTLAPVKAAIYYIGKCYGDKTTVRGRWAHDSKTDVWRCIDTRTKDHRPIVAEFELPKGVNLSKKLVDEIECLLIFRLQPPCNVQCKESRGKYRRPGMKVVCVGKAWPLSERTFRDDGDG